MEMSRSQAQKSSFVQMKTIKRECATSEQGGSLAYFAVLPKNSAWICCSSQLRLIFIQNSSSYLNFGFLFLSFFFFFIVNYLSCVSLGESNFLIFSLPNISDLSRCLCTTPTLPDWRSSRQNPQLAFLACRNNIFVVVYISVCCNSIYFSRRARKIDEWNNIFKIYILQMC